jgi:hypothetical protein
MFMVANKSQPLVPYIKTFSPAETANLSPSGDQATAMTRFQGAKRISWIWASVAAFSGEITVDEIEGGAAEAMVGEASWLEEAEGEGVAGDGEFCVGDRASVEAMARACD